MHILFATPEIAPFHQEGKLGDFCATLTSALQSYKPYSFLSEQKRAALDLKAALSALQSPLSSISVVTPLYGYLDKGAMSLARRLDKLEFEHGGDRVEVVVYEGQTPGRARVFFLEHEQFSQPWVYGPDNQLADEAAGRFGLFSHAIVEFCQSFPLPVDIIHCQGWATGLVPIYLDLFGDERLDETLTVFTLHELEEQGSFPKTTFPSLRLPKALCSPKALENNNRINFTQAGVLFADFITTVSPAYAEELAPPGPGSDLDSAFAEREEEIFGISSGIDYRDWNPSDDSYLPIRYSREKLNGKRRNKAELQHIFGLPPKPMIPLFGFLSPLREAKGAGLVCDALETLLEEQEAIQCIVLAHEGDDVWRERMCALQKRYPKSLGLHFARDEALEHRVIAGIDMVLLPSKREPDGIVQLRAMRYGTVPIARTTGTLRDTIADWDDQPVPATMGAGITFDEFSAEALLEAMQDALGLFRRPRQWRPLLEHCMRVDFSWKTAAHNYIELYQDLLFFEE